jgi:hypothetical protein
MVGYDANHVTIRKARSGQFSVRTQDSIFLAILSEIRNQRIAIASTFEAPLTRIATVLVSEKRTYFGAHF